MELGGAVGAGYVWREYEDARVLLEHRAAARDASLARSGWCADRAARVPLSPQDGYLAW
jgi:hypothetical protein